MSNLNGLSKADVQALIDKRVREASQDPNVFIDRFCYTYDPKTPPYHLEFRSFPFQRDLMRDICQAIDNGYDLFVEKCREMGVTYTAIDVLIWYWLYKPGSNFLLGSRKEDYVDNTGSSEVSNKEESLFGKIEYTLRRLPPFMLPKGFEFKKHLTYMSLQNPENGNVITGESSNDNFSRGSRRTAILLDEFSFWQTDAAAWGATADTTRCRIVLTTPGIKPSKAKRLRFGKDGEHIKVLTLPYSLDPRKDQAWYDAEKARRSESDFAREILIDWETAVQGRVYSDWDVSSRFLPFAYDPNLPLHLSWDFGINDPTVVLFIQPNGSELRLVDYYEASDANIEHFVQIINAKPYHKPSLETGDVAGNARELTSGKSPISELARLGHHVRTSQIPNIPIQIRHAHRFIPRLYVSSTNPACERFKECLTFYRYPEKKETVIDQSNEIPIHDEFSHAMRALEYYCWNIAEPHSRIDKTPPPGTVAAWIRKQEEKEYLRGEFVGYD